jgi:alcohol dehydrogenase class IV
MTTAIKGLTGLEGFRSGVDCGQVFNFLPVPTDVHFGYGVIGSQLEGRVRAFGVRRVLLVTDPGVRDAGIVDRVKGALTPAGVDVTIYDDVTADSGSTLIVRGVEALKAAGSELVIGVGGGSALDTAKAIAALATNPGSPLDYIGLHKVKAAPLPVIAVPTTAGTGSEVSLWSVFTDDARRLKVAIGGVPMYPAVALCDPELTLDLPPAITASTGMDALAHAIECYTNKACQSISAALALKAIELIGRHLRGAALNGSSDRASRSAMMLASTMAGMAMNSTRLGLAHALAMPLGSWDLKIPHSVAIAVTLPLVMEFNYCAAPERFASVARALGEPVDGCPALKAASRAPSAVAQLANDIGIPKGLSTYGLTERHVPEVIDEAMKSGNVAVNPRSTTREELAEILRRAL